MSHITESELSAYIDGEVQNESEIQQHLEECPQCAEKLEQLKSISDSLQTLPTPDASDAFGHRVVDILDKGTKVGKRPYAWRYASIPVALLSLLAFVIAFYLMRALYPA